MAESAGSATYLSRLISGYYKDAAIGCPERVEEREFGVGTFERKILYRHLAFANAEGLRKYLVEKAPAYVSYSTAYYRFPGRRPMENKEWKGSELVFDLDVTDMKLGCQANHQRSWVCENCFSEIKMETIKLIEDFLVPDFGFSREEIKVNFSGNRGYHVHVKDQSVLDLGSGERKQISDYISGAGIEVGDFFPTIGMKGVRLVGPTLDDMGWKGKIAKSFISNLEKGVDALCALGIERKTAANLYRKRALISMGIKNGNWDMVYIKNKAEFWERILLNQSIAQGDRIDKNVTIDRAHLIRMPNTLHGGSGLVAMDVPAEKLDGFDPMKDAIAFRKGELKVRAKLPYKLFMGGEEFGPYGDVDVELPIYAAVYLHLKGLAYII